MKKFILGGAGVVVVAGLLYFGWSFIGGLFGGGQPVAPQALKPGATEFGTLKVSVFGRGSPLAGVEVDLGTVSTRGPTGPMAAVKTDAQGAVTFENVPVGTYDIFWNSYAFPSGYNQPSRAQITISKNQITTKRFDLAPR